MIMYRIQFPVIIKTLANAYLNLHSLAWTSVWAVLRASWPYAELLLESPSQVRGPRNIWTYNKVPN